MKLKNRLGGVKGQLWVIPHIVHGQACVQFTQLRGKHATMIRLPKKRRTPAKRKQKREEKKH